MTAQTSSLLARLAANKKATLLGLCIVSIIALVIIHLNYPTTARRTSSPLSEVFNMAGLASLAGLAGTTTESPTRGTTTKPPTVRPEPTPKPKPAGPSVIEIPDASKAEKSMMPSKVKVAEDTSNHKQNLPSAIVIGTPACGVTPLYAFLRVHPKIQTTAKELYFFSNVNIYEKGVDWYRAQMPPTPDDVVLVEEAHHAVISDGAPERLKAINPKIKIIYVICDATFRAFAQYLDMINLNDTTEIVINGTANKRHKAIIYSQYSEHFTRWLKYFPRENFYILESDMLLRNPIEEMGHVEDFLGVSTMYNPQFIYFNSTAFTYCVKDHGVNTCLKPNAIAKAPTKFPHPTVYKVREYLRPFSDKMFEMVHHKYNWL